MKGLVENYPVVEIWPGVKNRLNRLISINLYTLAWLQLGFRKKLFITEPAMQFLLL